MQPYPASKQGSRLSKPPPASPMGLIQEAYATCPWSSKLLGDDRAVCRVALRVLLFTYVRMLHIIAVQATIAVLCADKPRLEPRCQAEVDPPPTLQTAHMHTAYAHKCTRIDSHAQTSGSVLAGVRVAFLSASRLPPQCLMPTPKTCSRSA